MPLLCGNNGAVQVLQANNTTADERPSQQESSGKESLQSSQSLFATKRRSSVAKWLRPARKVKSFGTELDQLPTHAASLVPSIIVRMRDFIVSNNGFQTEGLFRVAGAFKAIDALKAKLNESPSLELEQYQEVDVHVVTGLMKAFFRDLPSALVPNTVREELITLQGQIQTAVANNGSELETKALVKRMVEATATLPPTNLAVLSYLIQFLHQLLEHTDSTKMTSHNLALIFSQIIFRDMAVIDMSRSFNFATESSNLINFLIRNFKAIFEQDDSELDLGKSRLAGKQHKPLVVKTIQPSENQAVTHMEQLLQQQDRSDSEDDSSEDIPVHAFEPTSATSSKSASPPASSPLIVGSSSNPELHPKVAVPLLVAPKPVQVIHTASPSTTPTVTPQPPAPTTPATPATPDPYTLAQPDSGALLNLRPQSADSLVRESPDYRQLLASQTTPSHSVASQLLAGSPHTPAAGLLHEAVSPLSLLTPTQPTEQHANGAFYTQPMDIQQPHGRSLRDRLTAGCESVLRKTGFQFACLSVLQLPGGLDTSTPTSRLVLTHEIGVLSKSGSQEPLVVTKETGESSLEPAAPQGLTSMPTLHTIASQPTSAAKEAHVPQSVNGLEATESRDCPLEQLPDRTEASEEFVARVVAQYKALAKVVRRFEREFEQENGRKVTGADREPVAKELKEYRRLRQWCKGSAGRDEPVLKLEVKSVQGKPVADQTAALVTGVEQASVTAIKPAIPRLSEGPATPAVLDEVVMPHLDDYPEGSLVTYRSVRKAYEHWRTPLDWPKKVMEMTSEQVQRDKSGLKQILARFDKDFQVKFKRAPQRSDKEGLRPLYQRYKELKLAAKTPAPPNTTSQPAQATAVASEANLLVAATQASLEAAADGDALSLNARSRAQPLEVNPVDEPAMPPLVEEERPPATEEPAVSNTQLQVRSSELLDVIGTTPVTNMSKEELRQEKHRLQKVLFKFQSEFEAAHGRKPRSASDRQGQEPLFARYKQLKKAVQAAD
eukprot:m.170618 g.170618  ORF g.170618 m.170618 type:complete len:1005 (+) comp16694_c0_seq2:144-3158(+)